MWASALSERGNSDAAELLGRAGLVAKGILYAIVAVIAIKVAITGEGKPEGQSGALRSLADESFGAFLLIVLAAGLSAYAIWRLVEVFRGPPEEEGAKAALERVASLFRALISGGLAALAILILVDRDSGSSGSSGSGSDGTTAAILGLPGGVALVLGAGIVLVGIAVYQAYQSLSRSFKDKLKLEQMSKTEERWAAGLGTAGYAARAVVYGLIAGFLIKAAVEHDPDEAVGLDGALAELAGKPYGAVLLGVVAGGLLFYALYSLAEALYRKV